MTSNSGSWNRLEIGNPFHLQGCQLFNDMKEATAIALEPWVRVVRSAKEFIQQKIQWPLHPILIQIFPFCKKIARNWFNSVTLHETTALAGVFVLHSFPHQFLQLLFRGVGCCYRWPWRSTVFLAPNWHQQISNEAPFQFAENCFIEVGSKMDWRDYSYVSKVNIYVQFPSLNYRHWKYCPYLKTMLRWGRWLFDTIQMMSIAWNCCIPFSHHNSNAPPKNHLQIKWSHPQNLPPFPHHHWNWPVTLLDLKMLPGLCSLGSSYMNICMTTVKIYANIHWIQEKHVKLWTAFTRCSTSKGNTILTRQILNNGNTNSRLIVQNDNARWQL